MMKKSTFIAALLLFATALPGWAGFTNLQIRVQYHQWHWEEADADGSNLLDEDGPLLGLEGRVEVPMHKKLSLRAVLEGFYGEVDYDGQTQVGDPVKSTTEYLGLKTEADILYDRKTDAPWQLNPLAGLGSRSWTRRLGNDEDREGGYDEFWTAIYGRLGVIGDVDLGPQTSLFGELVLRLPIFSQNSLVIEFEDDDDEDVYLEPEGNVTVYAELGVQHKSWIVSASLETFSFDQSDDETVRQVLTLYQPESEGYQAGVNVGLVF